MEDGISGEEGEPGSPGRFASHGRRRDVVAYGCMALMVLIGSTSALSAKLALRELPLPVMPVLRFGIAGLALLPIAWRGGALARVFREDGRLAVLSGLLCVPLNQAFFLYGARLAPTTHIGLIYATCPLVVLLSACLVGQERLRPSRLAAVLASVSGLLVMALGNFRGGAGAGGEASSLIAGDLLLVGAVLTWGLYITASKPLIARHGALPSLAATFLVGSGITLIPSAILLMTDGTAAGRIASASPATWVSMAHLALVVSVLGLLCQNVVLKRVDASEMATVGNAAPLLTVVWGAILLGEPVTPYLALGGVLTVGGILWAGRTGSKPPARVVPPIRVREVLRPSERPELLAGARR